MTEFPEFEWPYLNLASAYIRDNQLNEAKFLLRQLLSINPDHVEAWYSLARIHAATFELEEAQQALAHARSLYTDDDDASLGTMIDCLLVLDDDTKLHDRAALTKANRNKYGLHLNLSDVLQITEKQCPSYVCPLQI